MEIHDWLEQNNLDYKEIEENVFEIDGKILVLIAYIEGELVIDKFFELILHEGTPHHVCDYYIFKFGGKYYYCSDTSNPQFNLLKYIGKYKGELNYQYQFPHLGIHGKYELCNGSRSYEDWIVKAKFLNINHIGICEQDTLAGTLAFQSICKKYNINYSLGLTTKTTLGNIKFYVKNDVGWSNLLKINYHLNNDLKTLPIELISELCEGLIVVFGSDFELDQKLVRKINRKTQCYYQIDSVEWKSSEKDKSHLLNLKIYCEKWFDLIPPVLICDSYYLDKEEYDIKNKLNKIGKIGFQNQSEDQYFKSLDEVFFQLSEVFRQDNDMLFTLFEESISNANKIAQQCSYEIKTNNAYLPTYPLKESEMHYGNSENLFWSLIEKGLEDKVISKGKDLSKYLERVEEEYRVIKLGGFVDYFLITWDILNFCKENDILTGIARGSAGGCLIAYILDIVQIDPLEYGLLFERFLNEGRMGFKTVNYTELKESNSNSGFEVCLENGVKLLLDEQSKVIVERDSEKIEISVSELQENDEIIL